MLQMLAVHLLMEWELPLLATAQQQERTRISHIANSGRDQNSNFGVWFLLSAYCLPTVIKLIDHKLDHHMSGFCMSLKYMNVLKPEQVTRRMTFSDFMTTLVGDLVSCVSRRYFEIGRLGLPRSRWTV
jgi:hypothetical protein